MSLTAIYTHSLSNLCDSLRDRAVVDKIHGLTIFERVVIVISSINGRQASIPRPYII